MKLKNRTRCEQLNFSVKRPAIEKFSKLFNVRNRNAIKVYGPLTEAKDAALTLEYLQSATSSLMEKFPNGVDSLCLLTPCGGEW